MGRRRIEVVPPTGHNPLVSIGIDLVRYITETITVLNNHMYDLTGFQRDTLYVIGGKEGPKGVEIKEELDKYYEAAVNHGRLYPNLDELVEKGLVEKGKLDDRTNQYTLTKRGRRELAARREWEDGLVDI